MAADFNSDLNLDRETLSERKSRMPPPFCLRSIRVKDNFR